MCLAFELFALLLPPRVVYSLCILGGCFFWVSRSVPGSARCYISYLSIVIGCFPFSSFHHFLCKACPEQNSRPLLWDLLCTFCVADIHCACVVVDSSIVSPALDLVTLYFIF